LFKQNRNSCHKTHHHTLKKLRVLRHFKTTSEDVLEEIEYNVLDYVLRECLEMFEDNLLRCVQTSQDNGARSLKMMSLDVLRRLKTMSCNVLRCLMGWLRLVGSLKL